MRAELSIIISADLADFLPTFLSDAEGDLHDAINVGLDSDVVVDVFARELAESIATDLDVAAKRIVSASRDSSEPLDRDRLVAMAEETRRVAKLLRAVVSAARGIA